MEQIPSHGRFYKQSFVVLKAKHSYLMHAIVVVIVLLVLGALIGFYITINNSPPPPTIHTPTPRPTLAKPHLWKSHRMPAAHLSFSAPPEMMISSEIKSDNQSNAPYSVTLYIQKGVAGQAGYYQLYGLYQFARDFTDKSLEELKADLEEHTARDINVAGFAAVEGRTKGERSRYVTHILTPRGMFSLFTSEPTDENKKITDDILSTFDFTD